MASQVALPTHPTPFAIYSAADGLSAENQIKNKTKKKQVLTWQ